tara:strand:+ start:80 stop:1339 length:1260 start_codon:yes stop_codon:yes gene_type:complete
MFKEIPAENANLRPFRTHKNYILGENDISVYKATSASVDDFDLNSIPAFDNNLLFDPINESKTNDFYQRALYQSTLAKYYHPDTKQSPIMGGGRISKFAYGNQRTLGKAIELLPVSQSQFGEEIKPGSIELYVNTPVVESKVIKVVDDGFGNLVESNRAAQIIKLDNETGEIIFGNFDGDRWEGTTDLTNFESGSLNVLTITPIGSADSRATAIAPVSILTMDFECGIIRFEDDDNPFGLITNWPEYIVGNVFYSDGLIVMNDANCLGLGNGFTLKYKATHTIYEYEYFLEVGDCEFNYSQNPTAVTVFKSGSYNFETTPVVRGVPGKTVKITDIYSIDRKPYYSGSVTSSVTNEYISGSWDDYWESGSTDLTGSYLAPFITTIGLYDENKEMLAVAKLPKPIKNLPDYPVNFLVRIDV